MSEETVLKAEIGKRGVKPLVPMVLIAAGVVLLVINVFHVNVMGFLWPGFIVGIGLAMMLPAYNSTPDNRSSLAFFAIPGAMVVANGALLFLMNMFDHFGSMAYAWTLVLAAGAWGYLYMKRFDAPDDKTEKVRGFIRVMVLAFMGLAAIFELLFFQSLGGWWPLLVIGLGLYLWIRESRSEGKND
ncbi:MAG: hypothetical protein ACK2T3_08075 [Candidatus Promineifilaceae bacterium]|jgi:hypothetical protein